MNKEIKVLHFFSKMDVGGAETLILNVMRNQNFYRKSSDFKHCFIVRAEGYYDEEIKLLGGEIIILPPPQKILRYTKAVFKIIKNINPNVVHSHVFYFSGWNLLLAKILKVPIRIAHAHTSKKLKNNIFKSFYISCMKLLIQKCSTKRLACSKDARDILFFEKDKFKYINNGIDLSVFNESSGCSKSEEYNLIQVGSFRPVKNQEKSLRILKELLSKGVSARLHFVGDGIELENIKSLAKKMKVEQQVVFHGIRLDIPELLSEMDLFIFPSKFEGLGLAVIEAQAAGQPCVITANLPKEIDMGIGLITRISLDVTDVDWASKVKNILIDVKNKVTVQDAGKAIKSNGYDIETTVQKLEEIYLHA